MMRKKKMYLVFFGGLVVGFLGGAWMTKTIHPRPAIAQIYKDPIYQDDTTNNAPIVLRWREVGGNINRVMHRARVPGGWLVTQQDGLTYIPDPDNSW